MTTAFDVTGGNAGQVPMPEYILLFSSGHPREEHQFTAISDEHAIEQMRKMYPTHRWTLYRLADGERRPVSSHPAEPRPE